MNVYTVLLTFFPSFIMEKSDAIRLRREIRSLAKRGLSVSEIARRLGVSRPFVYHWKDAKDPTADERGWIKGRKRKYTDEQERDVLAVRTEAEKGFFLVLTH
jgi:transposase